MKGQGKGTRLSTKKSTTRKKRGPLGEDPLDLIFRDVRIQFERNVENYARLGLWMSVMKPEVAAGYFADTYRICLVTAIGGFVDLLTQDRIAKDKWVTPEHRQGISEAALFVAASLDGWEEAKRWLGMAMGKLFLGNDEGYSTIRTAFEKKSKGNILACLREADRRFALRCAILKVPVQPLPQIEIFPPNGPGIKRVDLSRYFDKAGLTKRQRYCASQVYEFKFRATEVAKELRIHRKTVMGHLEDAVKKIALNQEVREKFRKSWEDSKTE